MHENAYVASVSLSADVNQTVKAGNASKFYCLLGFGVPYFNTFFLKERL